jgi:hypothetical protein
MPREDSPLEPLRAAACTVTDTEDVDEAQSAMVAPQVPGP